MQYCGYPKMHLIGGYIIAYTSINQQISFTLIQYSLKYTKRNTTCQTDRQIFFKNFQHALCTVLNSLSAILWISKNAPHQRLKHSIYLRKSSSFIAFDPIFTEIHENVIPHVRRTNDIFLNTLNMLCVQY